jgi:DNA-binding CsgD family transcriptional regulator
MAAGDPVLELRAHVLRAVVAVVPADAAVFITLSRRRAIKDGVALVGPGRRVDLDGVWARYAPCALRTDPFAPPQLDPPGATVMLLAQVAERAPGYVDHLRAAGWTDRAAMYLRGSGMVVGMVSLLRTEHQPRFTANDASALRQLHALVEHAYVAAVEPSAGGSSLDALRESGLTAREAEVAELVARGASNADIGRALHLSELTVKTHLTHVYAKVGVQTRTQLAILLGGSVPSS